MSRKKKNEVWGQNGFEDWGGYMAAKKAKLEEQFHNEASKEFANSSNLFKNIAIFVNGYTNPTADELRRLMMIHGGTYHHYMRTGITTHIIASNLPYSKIVMYRKSQNPLPICKPEWITDSISAGRILNFQNYLLYSNCTEVQPQLNFCTKQMANQELSVNQKPLDMKKPESLTDSKTNNNIIDEVNNKVSKNDQQVEPSKPSSKNTARCTKDTEFLSEFYNNSRLHHISTMGAMFKDYINDLRDKSDGKFPGLEKLKKLKRKLLVTNYESGSDEEVLSLEDEEDNAKEIIKEPIIMHIDMDCFFVSVGIRNKPELKGVPIAVTHAKGNKQTVKSNPNHSNEEEMGSLSEIASCSYEARKMGIKNGMFLGQALKLCPNLKTIPYDFEGYKEVSYSLYDTVALYTLNIEAVSCDEMYADCSKVLQTSHLTPMEFATIIREEIKQKTGCPVSTGFGNNKLQARLATKRAKPDGQFYLKSEEVQCYIRTFNVRDLPGVGYSTAQKLNGMKVQTCVELQDVCLGTLQKEFGKKTGEILYNMCRGIDNSKLQLEHVRKSVSAEVNYGIRFDNNADAVDFLKKLSNEVCSRLKKANAKGRCITLKMMVKAKEAPRDTPKFMGHGLCDYLTRSKNLITAIDELPIITKEVISLWNQVQQVPEDMRGIGIQISKLEIMKDKANKNMLLKFVSKPKQVFTEHNVVEHKQGRNMENICNNVDKSTNFGQSENSKDLQLNGQTSKSTKILSQPIPFSSKNNLCQKQNLPAENNVDIAVQNSKNGRNNFKSKNLSLETNQLDSVNSVVPITISEQKTVKLIGDIPQKTVKGTEVSIFSGKIDNEVLKELPEDIQNEIKATMYNIHRTVEHENKGDVIKKENNARQCNQVNENDLSSTIIHTSKRSIIRADRVIEEKANSQKCDDIDIIVPSQDIDDSVFNELPADIKSEIIIAKQKKRVISSSNEKKILLNKQRSQEEFFKHTKSNCAKVSKAKMPPLQEIDMSVLIELPEDIRNEILNEYSAKKREADAVDPVRIATTTTAKENIVQKTTDRSDTGKDSVNPNSNCDLERDLSFSQIDPDFLAALPEDMKRDVQAYCTAMKKDREHKSKKKDQIKTTNRNTVFQLNGRKSSKQEKNTNRTKLKNNNKNTKNINSTTVKKNFPQAISDVEYNNLHHVKLNTKGENGRFPPVASTLQRTEIEVNEIDRDDVEAIIAHNRTIIDNDDKADEYQETLIKIVNNLFSLSLKQVKMQIQTWITRSKVVNEVDFLSLATFLSMLPEKKRIEDLHILLKTMHRCTVEIGSCIWHRTYRKTVKYVQHYMQIEYNSSLMIPPIRCNLHKCNGDGVV